MAKDIIPLVASDVGNYNVNTNEDITIRHHNVSPIKTGSGEFCLGVRPSFGTAIVTMAIDDNSRGRGIADFKGYDLMMVNDDTWYRDGGSTEIHAATPFDKEAIAKFTLYSQAGSDRLVLVNAGDISTAGTQDGSIWFMTDTTSAPTEIADADAPGYNGNSLVRGGVSLDGYFFVGDILGNIINCDLDDLTAWTSTSLVVAEREADTGIYIGKHQYHVFFLGTRSLEFFYNNANAAPASPLTRRVDVFYNVGCYHPNTVLELGDITFFIGKDISGESGLYKLENMKLDRVGTNPIIDKMIRGLDFAEPDTSGATDLQQNVYLAAFNSELNGQFLVLTMPSVGTFALHVETQTWARWYLGGTPTAGDGGIADWEDPKILPLTASLNRSGANANQPNRFVLLNGLVSSESVVTGTLNDFSYSGKSLDATTEVTGTLRDIFIGDSGTKIFVAGKVGGGGSDIAVWQYNMSTAYDISTATYSGNMFNCTSAVPAIANVEAMRFNTAGTKFYITDDTGLDEIYEFDVGTAWDLSTASYGGSSIATGTGTIYGIEWNPNGIDLMILDLSGTTVDYFIAGTAFDITTIGDTTFSSGSLAPNPSIPTTLTVNSDGTKMFIAAFSGGNVIHEYDLAVAYQSPSESYTGTSLVIGEVTSLQGLQFSPTGIMYVGDNTGRSIYQYGNAETAPEEFAGGVAGVDNPDWVTYTKPWDLDTNERKRVNNIRLIHYPDTRTALSPSNIELDWIDTELITIDGIDPATFVGGTNMDVSKETARVYRGGTTRQRLFKLAFNGTKTQIIKGLEIDYNLLRG